MSEELINSNEPLDTPLTPEEKLEGLKAKAKTMGIKFHPKIGHEKLLAKIQDAMGASAPLATPSVEARKSLKEQRRDALLLVRVRVSPMNVHMNGLKGQYFAVANRLVGTVKKYIPFNSPYGCHVPKILKDEIESKQYQVFREHTTPTGKTVTKNELVKAYAVEYLQPLTRKELMTVQDKILATDGQEDY